MWGDDHNIVAVENDQDIAAMYLDLYPNDQVLVEDANEYLLFNYEKYDFIWSSPPCPTHSRMVHLKKQNEKYVMKYPDMRLYQEIILLKSFYKGWWVVENVKSYYDPLIKPQESGGHYFWSNIKIPSLQSRKKVRNDKGYTLEKKMQEKGIFIKNFYNYKKDKRTLLNNAIEGDLGLAILENVKKGVKNSEFI